MFMPPRHKDAKGHKGNIFFILKIKTFGVSLCLCAFVAKIRWWILDRGDMI
jgi:hypothetical protein